MKTKPPFTLRTSHFALAVALLSTLNPQLSIQAQGTAFTYQGRLNDGANPANGSYDLQVGTSGSPAYCDGTAWVNGSDRNAKENFKSVDARDVLAKVAALPRSRWNYKADKSNEHLGPMAQDFHASFGLNGTDDKHIATVDEEGVALAAIQGLNEKVEVGSESPKSESRNSNRRTRR